MNPFAHIVDGCLQMAAVVDPLVSALNSLLGLVGGIRIPLLSEFCNQIPQWLGSFGGG